MGVQNFGPEGIFSVFSWKFRVGPSQGCSTSGRSQPQPPKIPPLKRGILGAWRFSCRKSKRCQAPVKLVWPSPALELLPEFIFHMAKVMSASTRVVGPPSRNGAIFCRKYYKPSKSQMFAPPPQQSSKFRRIFLLSICFNLHFSLVSLVSCYCLGIV